MNIRPYRIYNHPGKFINGFFIAGVWVPLSYAGIILLVIVYGAALAYKGSSLPYLTYIGSLLPLVLPVSKTYKIILIGISCLLCLLPIGQYISYLYIVAIILHRIQILMRFSHDRFVHPKVFARTYARLIKQKI